MRRIRQFWRRLSTGSQIVVVLLGVLGVAAIASDPEPSPQPIVAAPPSTPAPDPTTTLAPTTSTEVTRGTTSIPSTSTSSSSSTSSTIPSSTTSASTATTLASRESPPIVVSVTDGDTLVVSIDRREERLRLIGINSPESGECFASEATDALAGLVEHGPLRLEMDQSNRDQFDRLLRYVYVGDVFVNQAMVEGGFAIARRYPPDTARADRLEAAQSRAEATDVGLWAPDACGVAVDASLAVGAVHPDADGDDNINLNDEWVEIVNQDGAAVDLTGWVVKDESASHRYPFLAGFVLEAGSTVRLHTGCGSDNAGSLYWCNQGSAVWNNSGDTVFLLDPSGNTVLASQYN